MRLPTFRGFSAAFLAVAFAGFAGAGRADARPSEPAASALALSVSLYCSSGSINCQAIASGGTGGYSFTWTNANEGLTDGSSSEASPQCWSGHTRFTVSVTVTDGTAATATASKYFLCP